VHARRPWTSALRRVADAIYHSRPDLQAEFRTSRDPEFVYWLIWHGIDEHPEVLPALYPQPPQFLRERVAGQGISGEDFHRGGAVDWHRTYSCLVEGGYDFSRRGRVLDFGCGSARTLRFFNEVSDSTTFVGCDIDREALAWCGAHIDFAHFVAVAAKPLLPFADHSFDAIVAFSVFTHLPERLHLRYLRELRRIAAPGAVIVLSTHGATALRMFARGERAMLHPPPGVAAAHMPQFEQGRFVFIPYDDPAAADPYGSAFVPRDYIEREWTHHFQLAAFHAAPDYWQDYSVLIPKADPET
jgi:SAM-dependent methyltransferase